MKRKKPLTCIIGAKCADGCAIIADTRVLREFQSSNESKISVLWDKVTVAGEGSTAVLDNFVEELSRFALPDNPNFGKVARIIEDMAHTLQARYRPRIAEEFEFSALVMGLKSFNAGDPHVRLVYSEGISEEVKDFAIIGHGAPYAVPFFRLLYDNMLTVNELAVLGFFTIASVSFLGLDETVGFSQLGPEAVILRANRELSFLNTLGPEFSTARQSLSFLKFRYKLIKSIWATIPQAFENLEPSLF